MKWPMVPLQNILSLEYGSALPAGLRAPGKIPVAGSNGISGFHDKALATGPGIVVGRKGSAGKVTWFNSDFWPIDTTYYVSLKQKAEMRFLYYLLAYLNLERLATSTGVPGLNRNDAYKQLVPFVPLSEQRRIVEILDQADQLRKLRAEADKKAERILPALFNKMFGDPATNPMGWETERLDQLFEVVGGGTPSKVESAYWQGDIPWVSPKDMKKDVITETEDHITFEAIANSATRLVNKGSLLIVYRSGILAHTFPVAIAGRELALNQDLKALNSKGILLNEYLYGWLIANPRMTLGCVKTGATVHNVDGKRFLGLEVGKPPQPLQECFAKQLDVMLVQKESRVATNEQLESLFALLLQRAFSGDLTATWREAHMKELLIEMEQQAKYLN